MEKVNYKVYFLVNQTLNKIQNNITMMLSESNIPAEDFLSLVEERVDSLIVEIVETLKSSVSEMNQEEIQQELENIIKFHNGCEENKIFEKEEKVIDLNDFKRVPFTDLTLGDLKRLKHIKAKSMENNEE